MMKSTSLFLLAVITSGVSLLGGGVTASEVTTTAADLGYGISATNNNTFNFDFTTLDPIWTAGSQRSANGSADPNNRRAGRVFSEFQLSQSIIDAANKALAVPGSKASLTYGVDSIGAGVTGTPYTDGLDLRYLGISASDRTVNTLWNTAGIGGDQADILATAGMTGVQGVDLTNPSILNDIANASAGEYLAFGMSNSVGVTSDPVGNSIAETYGFQINHDSLNSFALSVTVAPEPASLAIWFGLGAGLMGFGWLKLRRQRQS